MIGEKERQNVIAISQGQGVLSGNNNAARDDGRPSQTPLRIALLTPYTGGNLGDASIQDAMIANLRLRLPAIRFSGLSLDCENFVERHGVDAFPLSAAGRPLQGMSHKSAIDQLRSSVSPPAGSSQGVLSVTGTKQMIGRIPLAGPYFRRAYAWGRSLWREIRHSIAGYHFLRRHDLLILSGGGQLDDEWGGAWGHPFAIFKWAILARIARVPCAIASVGVGKVTSAHTRFFLSGALRAAQYRSYREKNSRKFATGIIRSAAQDPVVPDLAFSLPASEFPPPAGIRLLSQGRTIIGISPIAYARPHTWPSQDQALYERYVQQMEKVIFQLREHGYFVVMLWSSLSDRDTVIPDILQRVHDHQQTHLGTYLHIPVIQTWKDLVALLQDVDFLVASRLHSAILGFLVQRPTIAVSFDQKVDWLMEDLGQTDYLLHIDTFTARDVLHTLNRIRLNKEKVSEAIISYQKRTAGLSASQYDNLSDLLMTRLPSPSGSLTSSDSSRFRNHMRLGR